MFSLLNEFACAMSVHSCFQNICHTLCLHLLVRIFMSVLKLLWN